MAINYKKYHRDRSYQKTESLFRNIFKKRKKLIQSFLAKPSQGRILDIGCSTGLFLDLFKKEGWETWGVEPSKSVRLARKKGHKVFKGTFEKAKLKRNFFDLVILNHTLEHMEEPAGVLKKVSGLLKSKGVVFVDVPNAGGLGARLLGKRWPYKLPDEHKHQFTKESLANVFKRAGFKVLYFESRSGIFEYADPILELKRKRFILDIISIPYSLPATIFNMGDSMSMIGEKK